MEINICYSCPDENIEKTAVSIVSVLLNSSVQDNYNIYIFETNLSNKNKKKLLQLKKIRDFNLEYISSLQTPKNKIIYFGCNTIVRADLALAYSANMTYNDSLLLTKVNSKIYQQEYNYYLQYTPWKYDNYLKNLKTFYFDKIQRFKKRFFDNKKNRNLIKPEMVQNQVNNLPKSFRIIPEYRTAEKDIKDIQKIPNVKFLINNFKNSNYSYYDFINPKLKGRAIKQIGYDSGNIVYSEHFKNTILCNEVENISDADIVILMCNNIIRPNIFHKLTKQFDISDILKRQKKVMAINLNALTEFENMNIRDYIKTIEPELINLLHIISYNSESLGVQGEFTADILYSIGIKNIEVIGCPALFSNGFAHPAITKKDWHKSLKPACNNNLNFIEKKYAEWNRKTVSEICGLNDPKVILQSEFKVLPYMLYQKNPQKLLQSCKTEILEDSVNYLQKIYGFSEQEIAFNDTVKHLFKFFTTAEDWTNFIKTRDFTYGLSLLGNIAALSQGIPAIMAVHDSSSYEICELLKIPNWHIGKINYQEFSLRKLYENADFSGINNLYPNLLDNYISFLAKNGLDFNANKKQSEYYLQPAS